ncbi:MAG: site-specific integrase [Chloroflexota bacterium]|nr:site-specific integrase [Chloroflexota bacterium]MDE3095629.1 site-specific integrase [Chloroflexota bacterium]
MKRSNGQGSIYFQKSRGLYAAAVDQGYVNGKRRRKIVFGKTVREVTEKLPHLQVANQTGMLPLGKKQKLADYLRWWIAQRPANRTSRGYQQIIENHIAPTIGRITLDKLAATHIDGMLNALRGELSDTTRHHIRAVLSVSLTYAERKSLVPRNVARLAEPISMPAYKSVYLDVAQANALLDAAKGHRLEALFTLAVYLGMRQGELLGLRWKDIDLDRGTIRVFGQLQSEPGQPRGQSLVVNERPKWGSERTIGLPPETSFVLDSLRAHRQRQRLERIAAGAGSWSATMPLQTERGITLVDNDLVFTTTTGRPLAGSYLDEGPFREVCRKASIAYSTREQKGLRFHDLRHSAATILLAAGVPERVVMEILGHSTLAMVKRYQHVLPGLTVAATERMDRVMGR